MACPIRWRYFAIRTTGMDCPLPDGDAETQAAALLRHLERFGALTMLEV